MICSKCGNENLEGTKVCAFCGEKFEEAKNVNSNNKPYVSNNIGPQQSASVPNGYAITALITGIISIVILWCPCFTLLPNILALIYGKKAIRNGQNRKLSVTGMVFGIIGLVVNVIWIIVFVIAIIEVIQNPGVYGV